MTSKSGNLVRPLPLMSQEPISGNRALIWQLGACGIYWEGDSPRDRGGDPSALRVGSAVAKVAVFDWER